MDLSEILLRVKHFIDLRIHLEYDAPIIIGLSGGADSVALSDILVSLGYKCVACHCNFQLREEESERDMAFAESVAKSMNIPFCFIRFDTKKYALERHISIEMACRELRYKWFEEQRVEFGARTIAIAHHRDDSVETVLLNLVRGTGISGLTGIHPVNGYIVRPLLCLSRADIESYLSLRNLKYVIDHTNKENIYTRNKIRLQVLPILKSINPAVYESIERTASNLYETESLYRFLIHPYIAEMTEYKDDELYISIQRLFNSPAPRTLLFEILKPFGFLSIQLNEILKISSGISGKYILSETHILLKDRDFFIVKRKNVVEDTSIVIPDGIQEISYPVKLTILRRNRDSEYKIPKNPSIAVFDADKICFPLTIRHWKQGDRFIPFGMKGSRKLSDYFRDRKFTLYQKQNIHVLLSKSEIIWIIGERCSDKFKVDEETTHILEIKCEK